MSDDEKVASFPRHKARGSRSLVRTKDVTVIGFECGDDRLLYIDDKTAIATIMAFIVREKIKIVVSDNPV